MPALKAPKDLADGVVRVRELKGSDADAYFRAFDEDPTLARDLGGPGPPDMRAARGVIARHRDVARQGVAIELAVEEAAAGPRLAGAVMLHHVEWDARRAEIGFWLARPARGRGLATRAVGLVVGWAFESVGLERVELSSVVTNAPARALAERLGFTYEGTLRERDVEFGRRVDVAWYGLLRREWRELSRRC